MGSEMCIRDRYRVDYLLKAFLPASYTFPSSAGPAVSPHDDWHRETLTGSGIDTNQNAEYSILRLDQNGVRQGVS